MRTLLILFLLATMINVSYAQTGEEITEKRNIFNKKGDHFLEKKDYKKAIVYYNLAWQEDNKDLFSVLKKAEAYVRLNMYPQAELAYRYVFSQDVRVNNRFKLKYALVLYENDKIDEFRKWIEAYNEIVNEEVESENYLISSEKRIQLYKDTAIVLSGNGAQTDSVKFKIKYEGYQYKRRTPDEKKISVVVSNGEEYSISAEGKDFDFAFQPMQPYKLIIQKENIEGVGIMDNASLSTDAKMKAMLNPEPTEYAEIKLETGMKFDFSSGESSIDAAYKNKIKQLASEYQEPDENVIDLTALIKEMEFSEGQVYTIRFVEDDDLVDTRNRMDVSPLQVTDRSVNIFGQSFFIVLPFESEANFTVKTNLEDFEKEFNPKKYALTVDDAPVFDQTNVSAAKTLSLMVNTKSIAEVEATKRYSAENISIIPGSEYILSLSKPDPETGNNIEIIVPLTHGVKYNLSASQGNQQFKQALAEMLAGRQNVEVTDEEVIDISILSKELEVTSGENLTFTLMPARRFGKQASNQELIKSSLMLDGKTIDINSKEKYTINIPFRPGKSFQLETDLKFVQENFDPGAYTMDIDTVEFFSEITIDTTNLAEYWKTGRLVSMNINAESEDEVDKKNQYTAKEVSILPAKEYILTVKKIDAKTGEEDEIIVPLTRDVKYDFTTDPEAKEEYRAFLNEFLEDNKEVDQVVGEIIDIKMLSKALEIEEGDKVSFSFLPVKDLSKKALPQIDEKSSLYLDNRIMEFTQIQKYTINVPLEEEEGMNMQTDLEHIQEIFEPGSYNIELDTASFFTEITIDTAGLGDRIIKDEEITDPVFDVITVNFDLNSYELSENARNTIQQKVIDELKNDKRLYVTIKGYTDALGDADYNLRLSQNRAESVQKFLKDKGIGENRIRTFSFGDSQALAEGVKWEDLSEEELKKHRKVEIVIYLPE